MVDLAKYVEVRDALDRLAAVEERLTPNEREMYHHLKEKYAAPGIGDFDDLTCLDVMLRNVKVRDGYGLDGGRDPGRIIDMPRGRGPAGGG